MQLLEERIVRDGVVLGGDILKVDSFLNQQLDVELLDKLGAEFKRLFDGCGVNKILTIEASGIAVACMTARHFGVPVVFAKKSRSKVTGDSVYSVPVMSFTHASVSEVVISREFIGRGDRVLIIDDFLARGNALLGLITLAKDAGAEIVGAGICVEKAYQDGGSIIRKTGVRVESLARIQSMSETDGITFVH